MRVTIDVDCKSPKRLRKVVRRICHYTGKYPEIRKSSGGKGYHVIVRGMNISYLDSIWIRYKCGDDTKRLQFDTDTVNKPRQILWSAKQILIGDRAGERGFSEWIKSK